MIKEHWSFKVCIVKENAWIIGYKNVAYKVQIVYIVVFGHIKNISAVFFKIKRIGNEVMGTKKYNKITAALIFQRIKINCRFKSVSAAAELIVSECRTIENNYFILRNIESVF